MDLHLEQLEHGCFVFQHNLFGWSNHRAFFDNSAACRVELSYDGNHLGNYHYGGEYCTFRFEYCCCRRDDDPVCTCAFRNGKLQWYKYIISNSQYFFEQRGQSFGWQRSARRCKRRLWRYEQPSFFHGVRNLCTLDPLCWSSHWRYNEHHRYRCLSPSEFWIKLKWCNIGRRNFLPMGNILNRYRFLVSHCWSYVFHLHRLPDGGYLLPLRIDLLQF